MPNGFQCEKDRKDIVDMAHQKKLFIIDGSYLLYRSFYAIKPLTTATGIPTQATFGFCRAIKKLVDKYDPAYIVVVWDSKGPTFRNEIYADYKATRQKPPNDLFVQKDYILQFLDAIEMPHLAEQGYEADDIIAGLAKDFHDQEIVLVCPDKDMYQLLGNKLVIFDPFKDKTIDQESFKIDNGFDSSKIPFYYALLGDTSDNIPGVKGIGEKTAQELVIQFESLDDLYQNLDKVKKERTRKLLHDGKDDAYLSLKLFILKPPHVNKTIQDLAFDKTKWRQAAPLFKELEFSSLVKDIQTNFPSQQISTQIPEQQSLFGATNKTWQCISVQDMKALDDLIALLEKSMTIAIDTETTGCLPLLDKIVGMSFAVDTQNAYYIPLAHENLVPQLDKDLVISKLKPILENAQKNIVMHNAKFDQLVFWNQGINIFPLRFDTLIAANLVRNEWQKISLKELSLKYLNEPMKKFKEIIGKHKTFATVPIETASEYAAHDALQTLKIYPILVSLLDHEPTLKKIFEQIDMPFYWVLVRMEQQGILVTPSQLEATGIALDKELATLEDKFFASVSDIQSIKRGQFNINSPKQIEKLLFDDLGLPVVKKSAKGQRSTDQDVLTELGLVHPVPNIISHFRELSKLKNTYVTPLPEFINPKTHRIHTNYSQTLVATGRLSSSDPNLQNIPAGHGFGMSIREAFVARSGTTLVSADYSQIELRVLAFLSQDPTLIDIFKHNRDIHTETAAQLFGVPLDQVTTEQRQLGKRINFSIIYGMSAFGLAKDLDIKQSDAKLYIEKYFARYPKVAEWMEEITQKAVLSGYSETWYGRRRYIPELKERNRTLFEAGKRMAVNSPVQGTQADIMKIAMINIDKQLITNGLKTRMILQIHDEIILETPLHELDMVKTLVNKEMEQVVSWNVPLHVTLRNGQSWAEITK